MGQSALIVANDMFNRDIQMGHYMKISAGLAQGQRQLSQASPGKHQKAGAVNSLTGLNIGACVTDHISS